MALWKKLLWVAVTLLGLASLAVLALSRGEQINALWIVVAGSCATAVSYRFYSKWLATKILVLNDERATPAVVKNDGKDFVPTNRWMVFGHHFAAIAGPGPLVGPVLAAQFGFLPGTLWFSIAMTIPTALIMGFGLRTGKVNVTAVTIFGLLGLAFGVWGGQFLGNFPAIEAWFRHDAVWVSWAVMIYGLAASILPVWMLLTPRDYLSTFLKLGTVAALAVAVIVIHPTLQMPSLTKFIDGNGLVFAGPVFPFVCITIACGAVSGFHSLIASGTTPKMLERESRIRDIGYGALITEMIVALMPMIAACVIQPGEYFAINTRSEEH